MRQRGPVEKSCAVQVEWAIIHAAIPPSTIAGPVASNATARTATAPISARVISSIPTPPTHAKDVADGLGVPASAICRSVVAPALCASRMMGRTLAAKRSAIPLQARCTPLHETAGPRTETGLVHRKRDALLAAGKHPSQHTIKATGVLLHYVPKHSGTEAALKRTECLLRLLSALPKAV